LFCEKCGNQLEVDTKFCVHCGTPVVLSEITVKTPTTQTWWTRRNLMKFALVIIISITCFFAYTLGWKFYQFHAATSDHRFDEAFQLYNDVKKQKMLTLTEQLLDSRMEHYLTQAINDYAANELKQEELEKALSYFEGASAKLITADLTKKLGTLSVSKVQFAEALARKKEKKYYESLEAFALVDKSDVGNYKSAQAEINQVKKVMYDFYKQSVEQLIANEEFIEAFSMVKKLMEYYPNDTALEGIEQRTRTKFVQQVIESVDLDVRAYQYEEALAQIDEALAYLGDNKELSNTKQSVQQMLDEEEVERADPVDATVASFNTGIKLYYGFDVQVANKSRFPLRSVTVLISLEDEIEQVVATETITLYDVPAYGSDRGTAYIYSNVEGKTFEYEVTDVTFSDYGID
jgi:hypothetical protein